MTRTSIHLSDETGQQRRSELRVVVGLMLLGRGLIRIHREPSASARDRTAWTPRAPQLRWIRTARKSRENATINGRRHDNRHTLVTEFAELGAGDEVIMSIAGHVSRAMLSRYSHVRMEAKRRALDEIAVRQRAADEKRQKVVEQQAAVASQSAVVQ